MFHALQENHEVEWIGGEVFQEKVAQNWEQLGKKQ